MFETARPEVPKPKRGESFEMAVVLGEYWPGPGLIAPPPRRSPSRVDDPKRMRGPFLYFELPSGAIGVYAPGPGVPDFDSALDCLPRNVHFGDARCVDRVVNGGIAHTEVGPHCLWVRGYERHARAHARS